MPQTRYERRGGLRLRNARIRLLSLELSTWIYVATWPFGKIECRKDSITIKAWLLEVSIPLQDIDLVEFKGTSIWRMLLLRGEVLKIRRRAGLPNPAFFYSYGLSPLVQFLQQRGVRVIMK